MKNTLTLFLALSATVATAQLEQAPPPPDLHLAGHHIEKAGSQRNTALVVVALTGAVAGMMISMDADNSGPAVGFAGVGAVVGIGLNVSANFHEKKAGRILQGRR